MNYKELASNYFFSKEYDNSLFYYSLALQDDPSDIEAKIGVLLSDFAKEQEDEAVALFEYYQTTKELDKDSSEEILKKLSNGSFVESEQIFGLLDELEEYIITMEDGIEYKDFLLFAKRKNSFKKALEDIMFSTKIIIHKKEDFIDFVNLLIENNFRDLALNYLENALLYYPSEIFFKKKLKQLGNKRR